MNTRFLKLLNKQNILNSLGSLVVSNLPKVFIKNSDTYKCILFTYFNWGNNPLGISEDYLDKRFKIFDKYTFPSVNAQTDKDFTWIILLNGKTPQKFKDIMTEYKNSANMCIKLVYVDNYDDNIDEYDNFKQIMKKYFSDYNDKWVLTCRCDNDDMLAKNYIEKMKENFRPVNNMFIDFIRGYNFDICNSDLNSYKCRSNHFIGYVEKFVSKEKLKLVYHCNHAFAKDYGYIRRINNKKYPLWCEIITGTNKLNELQGRSADSYELNYFNQYFVQKYN